MRNTLAAVLATTAMLAAPTLAESSKASPNAPGEDRACLVPTGTTNSWNDADIVSTKWLPRKAAESQSSKDPTMIQVFDYSNDPPVLDKTYASAEELCNEHFLN